MGGGLGIVFGWVSVKLSGIYMKLGNQKNEDNGLATAMISILLIALVFLTFTLTTLCQGNGYLAVYLVGMIIGNSTIPLKLSVTKFMNGITWLAQIVVFIMLGLLVNPHEMLVVAPVSILIGAFMIIVGRPVSVFLCLAPFKKVTGKARAFASWVGLRGAVPIIFATYPVIADVPGASQIFNIVFFVTIISLVVQGTSIITVAKKLKLVDTEFEDNESFGVELSDEHTASLQTIILSQRDLENGNTLRAMQLPEGTLVMMIRREGKYIIPNGKRRLFPGDALLLIKEDSKG
ncbi:MAG: cation:proton antiporter [Muribaculaceae bacterium]